MDVTIEPLSCGTLTAGRSMFERGADDTPVELPVPSWLEVTSSDRSGLFVDGKASG